MAGRGLLDAVKVGLLFGLVGVYVSLVGMVEILHNRPLLGGPVTVSLGQALLMVTGLGAGYVAARRRGAGWALDGAVAGALAGGVVAALILAAEVLRLRTVFVNASPGLFEILRMGRPPAAGAAAAVGLWAVLGLAGAGVAVLPGVVRRPVLYGLVGPLVLAIFQDLLQLILQSPALTPVVVFLFAEGGPAPGAAAALFGITAAAVAVGQVRGARARQARLPRGAGRAARLVLLLLGAVVALLLPVWGGPFVAQVLVFVGLYTMMGYGLNLEVGFAGLLDLGFVAFFAIAAYTVGLLTSTGPLGIARMSFWLATPIAVLVALVAGVLLGVPVLGIRGDYLAIATLGFGEIVRLLFLSDFLRPWLGGSQGVLAIPKPVIGGLELSGPQHLYYVTVVFSAFVAYLAWRLQDSRTGRAWMAIREDEDVAQALGIDLVKVKLLAYGLGAAMAGAGGAIFAVMVGSIFPHSFNLLISINVLALIIVGGMGSLPGVVVGALVMIGLPELLREFGEFRFLVYGAVLVAMMLLRPEGLWPAAAQRRELHAEETVEAQTASVGEMAEAVAAAGGKGPTGG